MPGCFAYLCQSFADDDSGRHPYYERMRFAILTHDDPFLHWDLLLEAGNACTTWRLLSPPDTVGPIAAERIADHRLMYLDYEGPVSGGRGAVTQWDAGELVWIAATPKAVVALVCGRRWRGRLTLEPSGSRYSAYLQPSAAD